MFNNHEVLTCNDCGDTFMGRKPAEGGTSFCSKCWSVKKTPVVTNNDEIPNSVFEEHDLRGGENNGD